jgi:short-subunit dehydrogenase
MSTTSSSPLARYGPWAVVTGASDGIGKACANELAAAGLNLILVARRESALTELARALQTSHGITVQVMATDLADPVATAALLERTRAFDVGLLVAAAGFGSSGPILTQSDSSEREQIAVNCEAVLGQCMHFGRRFAERKRGGVVLFSSVVAFHGTPWSANYAATKAYVQSLAEALRHEWAPLGIQVVASAPGPVATGFSARARLTMGASLSPEVVARQSLRALHRGGTVRPGWLSKLLGWSLATAPRALRVRIMGGIMHGMSSSPADMSRTEGRTRAV